MTKIKKKNNLMTLLLPKFLIEKKNNKKINKF